MADAGGPVPGGSVVFDVVSANMGAGHQKQPYYRGEVHERSWRRILGSAEVLLAQEARWPPDVPRDGFYTYPFKFSASFVVTHFPAELIAPEEAVPSLPADWRPIVAAVNVDVPGCGEVLVASVHARAERFPQAVPDDVRRTGEEAPGGMMSSSPTSPAWRKGVRSSSVGTGTPVTRTTVFSRNIRVGRRSSSGPRHTAGGKPIRTVPQPGGTGRETATSSTTSSSAGA
jgi:hypothetical protein